MDIPKFRVKPYAHPKYKFVVRAKLAGKWKRSYFQDEKEATVYARKQNAAFENRAPAKSLNGINDPPPLPLNQVREAVVILGMHRSGTSALAGALNLLGIDFGENLAPA